MLGTCVWKLDTFFMNEWLGKPVLPTRGRPLVFPGELVLQRTDFWCCKGKFRCCRREFKDVCTIFFFPVLCFDGDTDSFRFFFSFGEKERFWKLFSFSVSSFPLNQLEGSGIPSVWYSGLLCNYSCSLTLPFQLLSMRIPSFISSLPFRSLSGPVLLPFIRHRKFIQNSFPNSVPIVLFSIS